MLKVGIVGFGFMGRMHYRCWKNVKGVEVTAICDANPNIVEDAKKAVGNIEGAEEAIDLSTAGIYADVEKLLEEETLDAVSVTLPTYLHVENSIKALEAGVHVLCEKPMALNVADCDRMIAAAQRSGKILQIGHCTRFWPEYAKTKEIIDGGEYGKVIAATFQRLAATAARKADDWFTNEKQSGGMVLDLHIHDTDFVHYLFGMPRAVSSFGTGDSGKGLAHIVTHYYYDDDKVVTAEGGWAMMPTFGFEMGFHIVLEKATIVYNYNRRPSFRLCPAKGEEFTPKVEKGDGYSLEIEHLAKLIGGEKAATVMTPEQARNSIKIVEAEKLSVLKGERVAIA